MKKEKFKGFILGIITSVIIGSTFLTVGAESLIKNIPVSIGGIKIYMDGNIQKPVDANGNTVEPMIYNGSTYLPVRALTGMLTDKEVSWDQKSMSVYIGKKPVADSTPIDQLEPYKTVNLKAVTGEKASFKTIDKTATAFNAIHESISNSFVTYKLDSNYSYINGKFSSKEPYGKKTCSAIEFYSVDAYGENEKLLDRFENKSTDGIIDVKLNIVGVDFLKINYDYVKFEGYDNFEKGIFYDITLTGL